MSRGDRGAMPLATQALMRAVLLVFASSLPLLAQTPPSPAKPAAGAQTPTAVERTPAERARVRAITDLRLATDHLATSTHDFRGEVRIYGPDSADPVLTTAFLGHDEDGLLLHRIANFTVVTAESGRQLEHGDGRWHKPDGEAPDCPLAPLPLLRAFVDAEVVRCEPTAHDDRPAQRVVAQWRGAARRGLLTSLAAPNAALQGKLERLASASDAAGDELLTDATLLYDPATRRFVAATVRVAVFDPTAQGPGDPPRAPAGLQPLDVRPLLAFEFDVAMTPPPKDPWPQLEPAARRELQAATKAPAETPPSVTPR